MWYPKFRQLLHTTRHEVELAVTGPTRIANLIGKNSAIGQTYFRIRPWFMLRRLIHARTIHLVMQINRISNPKWSWFIPALSTAVKWCGKHRSQHWCHQPSASQHALRRDIRGRCVILIIESPWRFGFDLGSDVTLNWIRKTIEGFSFANQVTCTDTPHTVGLLLTLDKVDTVPFYTLQTSRYGSSFSNLSVVIRFTVSSFTICNRYWSLIHLCYQKKFFTISAGNRFQILRKQSKISGDFGLRIR